MSKKSSSTSEPTAAVPLDMEMINMIVEEEIQLRRFGNARELQSRTAKEDVRVAWQQDRNSLEIINSSLKYTEQLKDQMMDTLDTFMRRIDSLLGSINQVQSQTEVWKTLHTNINRGLTSVQDILAKFERIEAVKVNINEEILAPTYQQFEPPQQQQLAVSDSNAPVASSSNVKPSSSSPLSLPPGENGNSNADPFSTPSAPLQAPIPPPPHHIVLAPGVLDLDTYLHNLDSILELERYFHENKSFVSAGPAISKLAELNGIGMNRIYVHFSRLLNTQETPLKIKHETYIETGDESSKDGPNIDAKAAITQASQPEAPIVQHVAMIKREEDLLKATPLNQLINDPHGIVQLVAEAAIRDLHKIIQRLQNAKADTKGIGGVMQYLETYASNRSFFLLQSIESAFTLDSISKSDEESNVQVRKKNLYSAYLSYLNPVSYWGYAESERQRERQVLKASSATYIKGSHLFLLFMRCLLVLLRSERALANTIIPSKSSQWVFAKSCEEVLSLFSDISEQLIKSQRRTVNRVYGASVLLDTYSTIKELLPQYEQVLLRSDLATQPENPVNMFWVKLTTNCRQMFQQFQGDIKNDASKSMPTDGNVHELTSSALNFLRHLFYYRGSVLDLLPPVPSQSSVSPLGDYIIAVISGLKENLEGKARKAEKKSVVQASAALVISSATSQSALANVFLINNYYFIWKSVCNSPLAAEIGDKYVETYASWIDEQKTIYRNSWQRPISYLLEENYKDQKSKTGTKVNASIKDRFKRFNSDMGELFNQQVQFFVPDEELRRSMRTILIKLVVPAYQAFWAKYSDVDFSKHREKYIRFDPETLETMLGKFFEGSLKSSANLADLIESLQQQNDISEAPSL